MTSAAAEATASLVRGGWRSLRFAPRAQRLIVYAACTIAALVTNYLLGKDLLWDTLNYHLYAGFSAVHDRFGLDYFAAGPQAYLNPYVYLPFYALVAAGLTALQISCLLAVLHAAVLWLTFELALSVTAPQAPNRLAIGLWSVALAYLNPLLIQQIGSSFADITTAIPVLGGWVLLLGAVRSPRARPVLFGGLLLGAATALKLTNAVHAIAGAGLLLPLARPPEVRIRYLFVYGLTLALGFALVAAPWAYKLMQNFGNPFFPLLNEIFRSPQFPIAPYVCLRFIPSSLLEALWRPFAIVNPVLMVQQEGPEPDIRYAALVLLLAALLLRSLWRCLRSDPATPAAATPSAFGSNSGEPRMLGALGCALTIDWILWLCTSGNGRYALPMACLATVVLVLILFRVLGNQAKALHYLLIAIVAVQGVQTLWGSDLRWLDLPWGGPWFSVSVPRQLATEPNLYLTMGVQSTSFLAPYVAQGSGLINFTGGYALGLQGANGARVERLIGQYAPRVRVLIRGQRLYEDGERREPRLSRVNNALERFGLRVVTGDCATISVHGLPPPLELTVGKVSAPQETRNTDTTDYVSCRTEPGPEANAAGLAARRAQVDQVLDRLEDACPKLFQPARLLTEHSGHRWLRTYINTDLTAWVSHGEVQFVDPVRADDTVVVGTEADWLKGSVRLKCSRRDGHYFASVVTPDSRVADGN